MTKKETAARKVMVGLVKLPRTPIKTVAEFINAYQIEGVGFSDTHGLTWAAQSRLHDAFVMAAALLGVYGRSFQKSEAEAAPIATQQPKRGLTWKDQKAARLLVVEMVKLARTQVKTIAEFIIANGVSGIPSGEFNSLSQAAHDRLYAAFKTARHLRFEAQSVESIRTIFEEHGTTTRNNRINTLLNNVGQYASNDLINLVRRSRVVVKPARTVARLKVVG